VTIFLGTILILNQGVELIERRLRIRDRILGRIFLTLTGFHGLHVVVGLILLFVGTIRLILNQLSPFVHVRMEVSI
jgi:cytochrome c oxidase subunit 3